MKSTYAEYLRLVGIIALLFGIGISARRVKASKLVFRGINWLVIYIMFPALVFSAVASKSPAYIAQLGSAAVLASVVLGCCAIASLAISSALWLDRKTSVTLMLNACFMNCVYIGFPVVYLLLGDAGLAPASIFVLIIGIMHLTVGVALAAGGSGKRISARRLADSVLSFPPAFALIVALVMVYLGAALPSGVFTTLDYIGKPAMFLMLLFVGYQLPLVNPRKYAPTLTAVGLIRFILSPLVILVGIKTLGIGEFIGKSALILAVMPPAVFNLMLARNFNLDLRLYGAVVFYLTFVSLLAAIPFVLYFAF